MTRKVEELVISFLRQNITGRASANTAVEQHPLHPQRLQVKLHGHAIATYTPFADRHGWRLVLNDCGWQTATTKSRLNALLAALAPGYRIEQRDHEWYLVRPDGRAQPWEGRATFDPRGCYGDLAA